MGPGPDRLAFVICILLCLYYDIVYHYEMQYDIVYYYVNVYN